MTTAKKNKILYRTFSTYVIAKYFIFRVLALVCAVCCFYNFSQNPIVTSSAGTIFLALFFFVGDNELIVYEDKFAYCIHSIIARKRTEVQFSELRSFQVKGTFGLGMDMISDAAPIYLRGPHNTIEVTLSNGSTKSIITYIYIERLRKASLLINSKITETAGSC